jgi:hypothetical protein
MMRLSRRSFFRITGGAIAAAAATQILTPPAIAAPLFVPAQNLDMGVPRRILTATAMPMRPASAVLPPMDPATATARMGRTVPMLLLHDEYMTEWGGRLAAGSTILVDQQTADRWADHRVAVPTTGAADLRMVKPPLKRGELSQFEGRPTAWAVVPLTREQKMNGSRMLRSAL